MSWTPWKFTDPFLTYTPILAEEMNAKLNGISASFAHISEELNTFIPRLPDNFTGNLSIPPSQYSNTLLGIDKQGNMTLVDQAAFSPSSDSDVVLNDIVQRTTKLETDIDAGTGKMGQYATTVWINEEGFQSESDVNQVIDSFNSTYKVSATLQSIAESGTLEKANRAQQFIDGADAYIKDQITVFNAGENSVDAQFSNVETKLDALNGSISQGITQVSGLEIDLKDANLNDIINAANELIRNQKLAAQQVKIAIAREELKAVTSEQQALALKALELGVKIDESLASAQQYTRTAVGYCVDVNGNISSENDAVKCVADSGSWVAGPLAEFIENLQISDGDKTASIKQLRQVFKTVDGNLVARGGWQLDNNGRAVGVVGYNDGVVGNLDLVGDVIRQGAMVGNVFVPTSYVDNTDPVNPQHVVRGRMELGDGYVVASEDDIKSQGKRGSVTADIATSTGVWYNSTANSAVPDGVPVIHDRVTIYKSTNPAVQTTKRFNGSVWETYTLQVHGSAIIQDTLDANVIRAGSTMTAPKIVGGQIITDSGTGIRGEYFDDGTYLLWIGTGAKNDNNAIFFIRKNGTGFVKRQFFQGQISEAKYASGSTSASVTHKSEAKPVEITVTSSGSGYAITSNAPSPVGSSTYSRSYTLKRNGATIKSGTFIVTRVVERDVSAGSYMTRDYYSFATTFLDTHATPGIRDYVVTTQSLQLSSPNQEVSLKTYENLME